MRELNFIVNEQQISQDPNCNFSGIVMGTIDYLEAAFSFSEEWDGFVKVAEFRNHFHNEEPVSVPIKKNNKCMVPPITDTLSWRVRVVGKKGNIRLTTNDSRVIQKRR